MSWTIISLLLFFACCIWIFCSLLFVCKCIYVSQALLQKKDLAVRISMPSLEVIVRQICWKIFSLNHFYPLLLTLFNPISFFLFLPLYYSLSLPLWYPLPFIYLSIYLSISCFPKYIIISEEIEKETKSFFEYIFFFFIRYFCM